MRYTLLTAIQIKNLSNGLIIQHLIRYLQPELLTVVSHHKI
jgi:hypothetical protein